MSIQLPVDKIFTGFVSLLDWPAQKVTTWVNQNTPLLEDKLPSIISSLLAKLPLKGRIQPSIDKITPIISQSFAKISSISIPASTCLKVGASLLGVCEHVVAKHIWNRLGPWKEALERNSTVEKSDILKQRLSTAIVTSSCFDEQIINTSFDTAWDTLFSQRQQAGNLSLESDLKQLPLSFSLKQVTRSIFSLGLHFYLFKFVLLKTFEVGHNQLPSLVSTPLRVWNEYSFDLPFTLLTASCYAYWTHQVASKALFRQDKTASSPLEASFLVEKMFSLLSHSIKPQTSQGAIAKCKSDAIEVLTTALFVSPPKASSRKPTPLLVAERPSSVVERRAFVPVTEDTTRYPSSTSQPTTLRERPSSTSEQKLTRTTPSSQLRTITPKAATPRASTPGPEATRGATDVARAGDELTRLLQQANGARGEGKTDQDEFYEPDST